MMKRLLLNSTAAMIILMGASPIVGMNATTRAPRPSETQNYAIAFDLDGVLFHEIDFYSKFRSAWNISRSSWIPTIKQLAKYGKGSMNTWRLICQQHGDEKGAHHFKELMLSKKVYKDTQEIIKRAHKKGYKLFLASNISEGEIALQSERLPDIFECFIDGVKVDDSPGNKGLKKPDPAYFKELKRIMLEHCGPNIQFIFIDDNEKNIRAARKEGFIGILCKNPAHLWKQLRTLGIRL